MRAVVLCSFLVLLSGLALAQPTKANDARTSPKADAPRAAGSGPLKAGSVPGCALAKVIDVRTLVVQIDGVEHETRLLGIEAYPTSPELRQSAAEFIDNTLRGETLTVVVPAGVGVDRDARPIVILRREPEGLDVGLELLRQGFATLDPKFDDLSGSLPAAQDEQYRAAAARAKALKKGFWAPSPRPAAITGADRAPSEKPAESPAKSQPAAATGEQVFVTPSGKKYHRADCKFLSKSAKAMALDDARKKYDPCGVCNPPK